MNEEEFTSLIKQLEKEYGKEVIMRLDGNLKTKIATIPSGSLLLDYALGVGGYPKGRIIEIYGPESSGKTTIALHAIAEIQKLGGIAAFIDAEHALDINYAKRIGVDPKKIIISQPDSGEQALELVNDLINSARIDLIIIDSVAALVPLAELEGRMDEQQMGLQARMMSKSMRKLSGSISKTQTTVIFINQIREKVGVIFGSPEITPGGRALKFFASVRIDIRLKERLKYKNEFIGQKIKLKIVKNKVAPPYREVETELFFDRGIDRISELITLGIKFKIIKLSGPWYYFGEQKLGQGKKEAIATIKELNLEPKIKKLIDKEFDN
ncbi:MAG: recombinase RecA [Mycoplasmataceae bacterium]|nr:recombinase RecA [Mycoplasmataceae bacterium]